VRIPNILRTVSAVLVLLFVNLAWGASEKVLYMFSGANPEVGAGLVFDGAGNLYGTTYAGGAFQQGSVFELSPTQQGGWTESDLYSFGPGGDRYPGFLQILVFDTAGNLYGTTSTSGSSHGGAVFKLTPNGGTWTESAIYNFKFGYSAVGLVFDAAGNLYGAVAGNAGSVFELSPASGGVWNHRVLHTFGRTKGDGTNPGAALAFDSAGNLYGTTLEGGDASCRCGTVFKLTPTSRGNWRYSVIHRFKGVDGAKPWAAVISDFAGNIYGTTTLGGSRACGCGVVFELSPNSNGTYRETVLHVFAGYPKDGGSPGSLILDQAGNLFGTTGAGGSTADGTVFKLTLTAGQWKETVLHSFGANGDGFGPRGLIFDSSGNLYGAFTSGAFEVTP
jgi:uncharacterized repeat protein (TIGR03803 family)